MQEVLDFFGNFFTKFGDLEELIKWCGHFGLILIVFAETGLMFGFFLPGDTLLFTAGLLASQGVLDIWWLNVSLISAAIIGDTFGYWFGKKTGPKIFKKEKSIFFAKDHLLKAKNFYEIHGGKTIILARFIPFIRTFAPVVAGIGQMNYKKFVTFNILGAIIWVCSLTLLGFFIGNIPGIQAYMEQILFIVLIIQIIPFVYAFFKAIYIGKFKKSEKTS